MMIRIRLSHVPVRAWINQPSSLQQFHSLDGSNVLAVYESERFARVYFTEGPVVGMVIPILALSEGWTVRGLKP